MDVSVVSCLVDLLRRETEAKSNAVRPSSLPFHRHHGVSETPSDVPSPPPASSTSTSTLTKVRRRASAPPSPKSALPATAVTSDPASDESGFPNGDGRAFNGSRHVTASNKLGFASDSERFPLFFLNGSLYLCDYLFKTDDKMRFEMLFSFLFFNWSHCGNKTSCRSII